MPALLQEVQLATAGAFKMPATKLFGRSPAGLNATGESDVRSWYDEVACYRTRQIKPGLGQLLAITDGIAPDAIEFEPLWQESDAEQAATFKTKIETYERLWSMGVASDAEIRKALHKDKPLAEFLMGEPTAEQTRAVTQIQVVPPERNAVAPRDPDAPDEPAPVKAPTASPFPPKA
jgi:phage-related protein (TIGR01555 family)